MARKSLGRIVIDTNVLFDGLTQQGSASGLLIEAWLKGVLEVCVSNALAYEYKDVLSRKLSESRWLKVKPILGTLLRKTQWVTIYYSWRPTSPDPGDDLVIDCAMNGGAMVVTSNVRDFIQAEKSLGLKVVTPTELIILLVNE